MNGVDGRNYYPQHNSMAQAPGPGGMMPPPPMQQPQHLKGMPPSSHAAMPNTSHPPPGQYPPTSITNQMQGVRLNDVPQSQPGPYHSQAPGYGPPASMHTPNMAGQPPVSRFMNSQPNHMMAPPMSRANLPPNSQMGVAPRPMHMPGMPNQTGGPPQPPPTNLNRPQYPMSPPRSEPQMQPNQPGHYSQPPQPYPSHPPMHNQPPMANQPQTLNQPSMPNQPHPYPNPNQPYANQRPQVRKLDPDAMPSPVQVIEGDKAKSGEPFRTDCPGLVPPLVTTDFSVEDCGSASPSYIRCATYSLPATSEIANSCQVPMALSVKPLARPKNELPIAIVDPGPEGPIRCKRCKAYMCPQFKFTDGGRRFQCSMCCAITETPPHYFNHIDGMNQRVDKHYRPELCKGSYEYVVTKDYCKNDQLPNAPAYIFAIDVSYNAVKSGLVKLLCENLKVLLNSLPCEPGTKETAVKVAFFTYDRTLHFYNLKSTLAQPQMLVVSDVSEIFVPLQDGFLVSLVESRHVIDSLLDEIPEMFADTRESEVVLAPVVSCAVQALRYASCSGKLFLFSTTIPTVDAPGKLKSRDNRKDIGTDKEKALFSPAGNFYTSLAKECVDHGCCVDLFLFPNQYIDIATIGQLAQLTGGDIFKYNYFKPEVDGQRFISDLQHDISRNIVFDAILRVRTSTGIRAVNFVGALHMTNTTDVELAGLDCDKAISVELKHDDKISEELGAHVQIALLYTSVGGKRRLRIHNIHLAVCTEISDLYRSCEADVLINYFAKSAIKFGMQQGMTKTKEELITRVATILAAYRKHCTKASTSPGQLILPECLKLLPVYLNSLLKNDCIHSSHEISTDDRCYLRQLVLGMDIAETQLFFYPKLVQVTSGDSPDSVRAVRCSGDRLKDTEAYLLHNGINSFLWIGSEVGPQWISDVFGVQSAAQIDIDTGKLYEFENPSSEQLCNLFNHMTYDDSRRSKLVVIRQRDKLEPWFRRFLVEDQVAGAAASYVDFLCHVHKEIRSILA